MNVKAGDVLLMWNMPSFAASIIDYVQNGLAIHHCAIVLHNGVRLNVWEATVPRTRYVPVPEYQGLLVKWADDWRYKLGRKPLTVEVWRWHPWIDPAMEDCQVEAARWLGVPYRLITNWLTARPSVHCSEFVSRCLVAAKLLSETDFPDRKGRPKEPGRRTPYDLREAMIARRWRLFDSYRPKTVQYLADSAASHG